MQNPRIEPKSTQACSIHETSSKTNCKDVMNLRLNVSHEGDCDCCVNECLSLCVVITGKH